MARHTLSLDSLVLKTDHYGTYTNHPDSSLPFTDDLCLRGERQEICCNLSKYIHGESGGFRP